MLDVAFAHNGMVVASASADSTVRIWEPTTKASSTVLKAHSGLPVRAVSFATGNAQLLTAGDDKSLKLWDLPSQRFHSSLLGHSNFVRNARFSNDNRMVLSGGDDKTVRLWDTRSTASIHTFREHTQPVRAVRFHPSGNVVAACGDDQTIKLWDTRTCKLLQHYNAHSDAVTAIDFHPGGDFLMSSSTDAEIKIWDLVEGRLMYTISGHRNSARSVAFSPNGEHFASCGGDQLVMTWKFGLDQAPSLPSPTLVHTSAGTNGQSANDSVKQSTVASLQDPMKPGPWRRSSVNKPPMEVLVQQKENLTPLPPPLSEHPALISDDSVSSSGRSNDEVESDNDFNNNTEVLRLHESSRPQPTSCSGAGDEENTQEHLEHIVNQLDIITKTLKMFEARLTLQESQVCFPDLLFGPFPIVFIISFLFRLFCRCVP